MKQVFASGPCALESRIMLDEKQAHHLFDVLRTGPRETIRVVCDGEVWLGHVEEKPFVWLFGKEETQKQGPEITLCTALIKSDKFEWMLQKAAELGVTRIVPFVSRYSVIQLDDKRALRKMERWNQILVNACRQCNRHDLVELAPVSRLEDLAAYKSQLNLVAYEKEQSRHLAHYLQQDPASVTCCIGPEGGFSRQEAGWLMETGFAPCTLGNRILRAETAALYVLACCEYQTHVSEKPETCLSDSESPAEKQEGC